jgi:hypothetical protein
LRKLAGVEETVRLGLKNRLSRQAYLAMRSKLDTSKYRVWWC